MVAGMTEFTLHVVGTNGLLMHNSRLADPLDPTAKRLKELTSKRAKTDDDHEAVAQAEFLGSLYYDDDLGIPYAPGDWFAACLLRAATKYRLGTKVREGVLITSMVCPLVYTGPRGCQELWEDQNFRHRASVKVKTMRVMRTRPYFREWRTDVTGQLDPNILDAAEFEQVVQTAGMLVGVGDWRPRYGRFDATVKYT